jgi:acetolactate synthase-1/2/3 large subunit
LKLTGAEIVIKCLKEQGVDTVFGFPGGAILNVYDALYKYRDEINHVLTSHEQGASHAADGYARATGKVGVCFATSGPGATNLVTGIATAYMDSSPIVAVTCNVGLNLLGKDSFQEIDITGITMPITKHNFIVKDVNAIADTIRRAFRIAKRGRPGPVLVDIPKDITGMLGEYVSINNDDRNIEDIPITPYNSSTFEENLAAVDNTIAAIEASSKPYVLVGGGMILSNATDELKTFVELIDAPVADTLMGKGGFPGDNYRYTGMLGMHGTKASNYGVSECDLLIALGARFSDRVTGNPDKFATNAKIVQIDIDPAENNKNIIVSEYIAGDLKEVLTQFNARLSQQNNSRWMDKITGYKSKYPLKYSKDSLSAPFIMEEIDRQTAGDAIITTEVGQHQMWAAQFYKYRRPRTFISSGGLGTMGFGLGASLGAKLGCPDKIVINIAGDGCFRMNMNEIATAVRSNIPIIQVVVNNHVLGMVRQWQSIFYEKRYSATTLDNHVDFVKLAQAMGAKGVRVTTRDEFQAALKEALKMNAPILIDCQVDEDDKVFPMVAPGAGVDEVVDR